MNEHTLGENNTLLIIELVCTFTITTDQILEARDKIFSEEIKSGMHPEILTSFIDYYL